MYYCGIDLGKKSSHFCILNKEREIVDQGHVSNRVTKLIECFGQLPSMKIVVEASTKSFWIAERLEEMGHRVVVVDPGKTKAIGSAGIKHDKLDAKILAELCAADLLARVDRPSESQRLDRLAVLTRDALVRSRARLVMSVRSILDSEGINLKNCSTNKFVTSVENISDRIPEQMWSAIEPALVAINEISEQIEDCDERIEAEMGKDPEVQRLRTVPGVGTLVASCFLTVIRDVGRFRSGRQVGAYLGLVPSLYQSGKTFRRGRITKHGNRQARWLLTIAANALLRSKHRSALKEWGVELVERLGRRKAVVAIARKLASVMWAMLKKQKNFEPRLATVDAR